MTLDISILCFERLKWGGVRHTIPHYAALDLDWFASSCVPPASAEDYRIFSAIIGRVAALPEDARPYDIEKAMRGLMQSNEQERRTIINILGIAGILIPTNRPTFWGEYPRPINREGPSNKNDWAYPVLWWRGTHGINRQALDFWFPGMALLA